ncbi:peptide/nickel transport system permease protein [Halorubrum aquaticum]|uniref:Peptide/nickel transport system permease protein n=1 Tax=Halorubrum aquaticum TaxID=387340 RepID=A0A1I3ACZ2_9EURY|nr:ABC transporter permease [Halorubrum aquaticum]SFH47161.1 peptide/nickel transport system permease protein [Halorubrum aquaticum]
MSSRFDTDGGRVFGIRTDLIEQFVDTVNRDLKAKIGVVIVTLFVIAAILAPELAPYDPMAQDFAPLQAPALSSETPLGTDSFGRDLLSRLMYGARISLGVGLGAVLFGAITGVLLGLVAGFYGGWVDDLLMRSVDVMWAFPWLLIAIMLVAIFGQGVWNVVVAVGFAYIDDFARITRGEVLSIREEEYVLAAESVGLGDLEIIFEEVFPNTVAPIIVQFTVLVARAMLAEATLSFLGLGVKPSTPTWGALLGQGRDFITTAWWISIIPGLLIMITVLGINLFGDALRDAFDVREVDSE